VLPTGHFGGIKTSLDLLVFPQPFSVPFFLRGGWEKEEETYSRRRMEVEMGRSHSERKAKWAVFLGELLLWKDYFIFPFFYLQHVTCRKMVIGREE